MRAMGAYRKLAHELNLNTYILVEVFLASPYSQVRVETLGPFFPWACRPWPTKWPTSTKFAGVVMAVSIQADAVAAMSPSLTPTASGAMAMDGHDWCGLLVQLPVPHPLARRCVGNQRAQRPAQTSGAPAGRPACLRPLLGHTAQHPALGCGPGTTSARSTSSSPSPITEHATTLRQRYRSAASPRKSSLCGRGGRAERRRTSPGRTGRVRRGPPLSPRPRAARSERIRRRASSGMRACAGYCHSLGLGKRQLVAVVRSGTASLIRGSSPGNHINRCGVPPACVGEQPARAARLHAEHQRHPVRAGGEVDVADAAI